MKPSVINCSVVQGLSREGGVMAEGGWDHFPAAGGSRFSVSPGLVVLCICMLNPGECKKSPGGDQKLFFFSF